MTTKLQISFGEIIQTKGPVTSGSLRSTCGACFIMHDGMAFFEDTLIPYLSEEPKYIINSLTDNTSTFNGMGDLFAHFIREFYSPGKLVASNPNNIRHYMRTTPFTVYIYTYRKATGLKPLHVEMCEYENTVYNKSVKNVWKDLYYAGNKNK